MAEAPESVNVLLLPIQPLKLLKAPRRYFQNIMYAGCVIFLIGYTRFRPNLSPPHCLWTYNTLNFLTQSTNMGMSALKQAKIWDAVKTLKKQGKIKSEVWGIYAKA